jgi:hypothetical protein
MPPAPQRPSPQPPAPRRTAPAGAGRRDDAVAVISAYGAFRLLLVLLAVWSFFAGFSLLTQGVGALSLGNGGAPAERIVGAQMLVLVPVYGLIAWRRDEYRLLLWIPYAAQLAVILPLLWDLVVTGDVDFQDGALMLIVSLIFEVLLVYFWWSSHPLEHFALAGEDEEEFADGAPEDEEAYEDEDELPEDEEDEEEGDEPDDGAPPGRRPRS